MFTNNLNVCYIKVKWLVLTFESLNCYYSFIIIVLGKSIIIRTFCKLLIKTLQSCVCNILNNFFALKSINIWDDDGIFNAKWKIILEITQLRLILGIIVYFIQHYLHKFVKIEYLNSGMNQPLSPATKINFEFIDTCNDFNFFWRMRNKLK